MSASLQHLQAKEEAILWQKKNADMPVHIRKDRGGNCHVSRSWKEGQTLKKLQLSDGFGA